VLEEEEEETGMVMGDMVDIQHSMVKITTQVVEEDLEMLLMVDMVVQEVGEVEVEVEEDLMVLVVEVGVMDILVLREEVCTLVEVEVEVALLDLVVTMLGEEMENTMVK
jgi:hypothetical protein